MKKTIAILSILIIIICFSFVGCKDKQEKTFSPDGDTFYTVTYVSHKLKGTMPDPVIAKGGDIFEPVYPTNVTNLADGYKLAWYTDEDLVNLYEAAPLLGDMVLYLGGVPDTYSVTYNYDTSLSFEGEFPSVYTYGQFTSLPTRDDGNGYYPGKWRYGEGEEEYFTDRISDEMFGDLVLTYEKNPIQYKVFYDKKGNLKGDVEITNDNIAIYTAEMGDVDLLPAVAEGYVFDHWKYFTSGPDKLHLQGAKIEKLDLDLICGPTFTLIAVWQNK